MFRSTHAIFLAFATSVVVSLARGHKVREQQSGSAWNDIPSALDSYLLGAVQSNPHDTSKLKRSLALTLLAVDQASAFRTSLRQTPRLQQFPVLGRYDLVGETLGQRHAQSIGRASVPHMKDEKWDLKAQSFDLLEGRNFRRDTIASYAAGWYSQELRILGFAVTAALAAVAPSWLPQLSPGFQFDIFGLLGCGVSAIFFASQSVREKGTRGKVLRRIESENLIADLSIAQPNAAVGFGSQQFMLESLRGKNRIVALAGTPSALLEELRRAAVYKRRYKQSGAIIVCVPFYEEGDANNEEWRTVARLSEAEGWVWQPTNLDQWRAYYEERLSGFDKPMTEIAKKGAFFALDLRGRACASGTGAIPWDELLGTKLQPLDSLSPTERPATARNSAEEAILTTQQRLYDSLTAADQATVKSLFLPVDDAEVTGIATIGRLDGWETVLKYDATVGMGISSQDVTISQDGKTAYSTGLEFPSGGDGFSLLCTQSWALDSEGEWKLTQHRTIPYQVGTDAPACLRCDHRGCVALQRTGVRGPAGMPGDGMA